MLIPKATAYLKTFLIIAPGALIVVGFQGDKTTTV